MIVMKIKKVISFVLVLIMLAALVCPMSCAAMQRFSDVKPNHWAYNTINTVADGGLVVGYPDGTFGPSKSISRAELAVIVARIKGYDAKEAGRESNSSYWAYDSLDYCINVLECMPSFGEIVPVNYNVPCTRELAAYVFVNGTGSQNPNRYNPNIKAEDIPDLYKVDWEYQNAVLEAYQLGLVNGMDDKGTFDPQGAFTRAQIATILVNSGFTTAAKKPDSEASKTLVQAEAEIKALGVWSEPLYNYKSLYNQATGEFTITDEVTGYNMMGNGPAKGITISCQYAEGGTTPVKITIIMVEQPTTASANGYKDYLGNPFTWDTVHSGDDTYKDTGIYALPSGYHYNSRQFVKQLLGILLPAAKEDAYAALKDVMLQKVYEPAYLTYTKGIANASRWLDGHYVQISFSDPSNCVFIDVYEENNKDIYLEAMSHTVPGFKVEYGSGVKGYLKDKFEKAFELDKW